MIMRGANNWQPFHTANMSGSLEMPGSTHLFPADTRPQRPAGLFPFTSGIPTVGSAGNLLPMTQFLKGILAAAAIGITMYILVVLAFLC